MILDVLPVLAAQHRDTDLTRISQFCAVKELFIKIKGKIVLKDLIGLGGLNVQEMTARQSIKIIKIFLHVVLMCCRLHTKKC